MHLNYRKVFIGTLVLLAVMVSSWELYWRAKGFTPTFNDDKALWAKKRKEIYQDPGKSTIFIGSSRIKFDLDIPTWRKISGEDAIQLALVGTSPLLVLKDLANDKNFKGKLVIDVTEPLFFSQNPAFHKSARESVEFYHKQTPSEKFSSKLNLALEEQFSFLEERKFALNALFNDISLKNRPGVFSFPAFPKGFELTTKDRQTYMSDHFLSDSTQLNIQTGIWTSLIMGDKTPPADGEALDNILKEVKTAVENIRSRGGKIVFVRTPSSGLMGKGEQKFFPREKYWNALLEATGAEGIHFLDYPETKDLICPEWSHLSREQAIPYTIHFFKTLREKNWFQ